MENLGMMLLLPLPGEPGGYETLPTTWAAVAASPAVAGGVFDGSVNC